MKQFKINGAIVDTPLECYVGDVCPSDFDEFIKTLDDNEDVEIVFNSVGGSVIAGIQIANTVKRLQNEGHKVTAVIESLAASIASVIACACETVKMYESSFMMVHNCWSIVQGNSNDLRKEADVMDKMNMAIMSFYKGKFNLEESEMKVLMDNETWFCGREATAYCFNCELIKDNSEFKIAAKLTNFKNVPKALIMENKENEEVKNETETTEVTEVVDEVKTEEEKTEETVEETEEKKEEVNEESEETDEGTEEDEEKKPEQDEIEKKIQARVSGMQSTMQMKINDLTKDFKAQLQAKDEELSKANAELTSLKTELENAKNELQKTVSAFKEKQDALDKLNSNVLTPKDNAVQVDWRNLKGKEFFDYLKKNNIH